MQSYPKFKPLKEKKMAYRYGDKRTAYNGVFNHVINKYPKSKEILGFYYNIPKDQQHCRYNPKGLLQFMRDYIKSKGGTPNKCSHKNAQYIQRDFQSFIQYCKQNLN